MTWDSPLDDLRSMLNDDPTGFVVKSKQVFPSRGLAVTGRLRTFYTLETRLVTSGNQALAHYPLRLFLEDKNTGVVTELEPSGIVVTDPLRGEFAVMMPPSGGVLLANYNWREWDNVDLNRALVQGIKQVTADPNYPDNVPDGLQMVAIYFAAEWAHRRAAHRWQQRLTEQFLLEDAPAQNDAQRHVDFHTQQAKELHDMAVARQDQYFHDLLGNASRPSWGMLRRIPAPYTPKR